VDRFMSAPSFHTTIIPLGNGDEVRVADWDDGRVEFNASLGVRSLKDLRALVSFHRRRKGMQRPFLVRDLLDYEVSLDETDEGVFGTGDGTTVAFQLKKNYVDDYNTDSRTIRKPEQGAVKIYVNSILKNEGVDYTINYSTGVVTFLTGHVPALGSVLEWTGRFFVPVRFTFDRVPVEEFVAVMKLDPDSDEYVVDHAAGGIPECPMIEVHET
jgi:uncharacterized protein (TIGR02217 family)